MATAGTQRYLDDIIIISMKGPRSLSAAPFHRTYTFKRERVGVVKKAHSQTCSCCVFSHFLEREHTPGMYRYMMAMRFLRGCLALEKPV